MDVAFHGKTINHASRYDLCACDTGGQGRGFDGPSERAVGFGGCGFLGGRFGGPDGVAHFETEYVEGLGRDYRPGGCSLLQGASFLYGRGCGGVRGAWFALYRATLDAGFVGLGGTFG